MIARRDHPSTSLFSSNQRPAGHRVRVPSGLWLACRRHGIPLTRLILTVTVSKQMLLLLERDPHNCLPFQPPAWVLRRKHRISASRYGTGQIMGSNRTPLGLHRIAAKIGAGQPVGAVFQARRVTGFTWLGHPDAPITNRILWLEGLEPGWNRGGNVDSHDRYIYLHGVGDETTLGSPASIGCIHLAGIDLLPLFDLVPTGTLVWIQA